MISRSVPTQQGVVEVRDEERPYGALLHALGWIPIWGFILAAVYWLWFRNRSRQLVFHVQQVVQLQILLLIPLLLWEVVTILTRVVAGLLPGTASAIQTVNDFFGICVLTIAAILGGWGAIAVYTGRPFLYPFIGPRILEASIRKMTEV